MHDRNVITAAGYESVDHAKKALHEFELEEKPDSDDHDDTPCQSPSAEVPNDGAGPSGANPCSNYREVNQLSQRLSSPPPPLHPPQRRALEIQGFDLEQHSNGLTNNSGKKINLMQRRQIEKCLLKNKNF